MRRYIRSIALGSIASAIPLAPPQDRRNFPSRAFAQALLDHRARPLFTRYYALARRSGAVATRLPKRRSFVVDARRAQMSPSCPLVVVHRHRR
jgi:hypothetical protein